MGGIGDGGRREDAARDGEDALYVGMVDSVGLAGLGDCDEFGGFGRDGALGAGCGKVARFGGG